MGWKYEHRGCGAVEIADAVEQREHGILGQISTVNSPALLRGIGVVMAFPDVSMKNTEDDFDQGNIFRNKRLA